MCADKSVIQDALESIMETAERYLCLPRDATVSDPTLSFTLSARKGGYRPTPLSVPAYRDYYGDQRKTKHVHISDTHI